jgi:hypothetical protein
MIGLNSITMIKKFYTIIPFLILCNFSFGQNNFSKKIKSDCEIMANAMLQKNYSTIIDYTYPKLVEMAGGKQVLLNATKSAFEKMDDSFIIEKITFGEPQKIYVAGKELHCIVPETLSINTNKGKMQASYSLLAVSPDKGKKWYFIETHKFTPKIMKTIFPNFNYNLVIPENTKPIIIQE